GHPATTIITSRGCPFDCTFCANKEVYGRAVRFHSAQRVYEEVKGLIDTYGVRQFRFHDDTMSINKRRLKDLSALLSPLNIRWRCNGRVDTADIETLTLLKEAGCDEVGYGVETASQVALDLCGKRVTVEQAERAIENTRKVGMKVRVFLVIGLPGDFGDMSGRIISFLERTRPDGANVSTLTPFPGCEIHRNPEKFGMKLRNHDFSKYRMIRGLDDGEYEEDFPFEYEQMSNAELKVQRKAILEYVRDHHQDLNR
ncbi:MAG: radical SAM protein, partial [Chloroflexi bacterium]|nr:radical SAM protein [Chloroflexota bacterium]